MQWKLTEKDRPEFGVEVIGFSPLWEDEDFNPKGVRIGFFNDMGTFTQARWNDSQDCYISDFDGELPYAWIHIPDVEFESQSFDHFNDQRQAMFSASKQNRLSVNNLDEFIQVMVSKSPVTIWNDAYSSVNPLYTVTSRIMDYEGGIWMYSDRNKNKTPKLIPFSDFYNELLANGIDKIRF